MRSDAGFSLLELTLSVGLMMMVTASVFTLVNPSRDAFSTLPERADMHQRLRVAVDALQTDVAMAGAGPDDSLVYAAAAVLPFRAGAGSDDPAGTYRTDRITLLSAPRPGDPIAARTYSLKTDPQTGLTQLIRNDGAGAPDAPVVDHVVRLTFEYYGDAQPPVVMPVSDAAGGWTTYGPKPPAPDVASPGWPPGENCVFRMDDGGRHVARLAALGQDAALVKLTAAQLTDGPWCPDQESANRWDADLLRVRRVGVTLRVEAASASLRGPASVLFTNGGTSHTVEHWVPDIEVRFQVTPRNLNLAR